MRALSFSSAYYISLKLFNKRRYDKKHMRFLSYVHFALVWRAISLNTPSIRGEMIKKHMRFQSYVHFALVRRAISLNTPSMKGDMITNTNEISILRTLCFSLACYISQYAFNKRRYDKKHMRFLSYVQFALVWCAISLNTPSIRGDMIKKTYEISILRTLCFSLACYISQ